MVDLDWRLLQLEQDLEMSPHCIRMIATVVAAVSAAVVAVAVVVIVASGGVVCVVVAVGAVAVFVAIIHLVKTYNIARQIGRKDSSGDGTA